MANKAELIAEQLAGAAGNSKIWGDLIYNVKVYGAKGDGVKDDAEAVQSTINAAAVAGGIVMFTPGSYKVSSILTVPSNVSLWFANGAKLSMGSGVIITINGPIEAGLQQIFSGSGTININPSAVQQVYPQWWGAEGDGINDDTVPIQSALGCGVKFVFLNRGLYRLTSQITVPKGVTIQGVGVKSAPKWVAASASWDKTYLGTVFAIESGAASSGTANAAILMSSFSNIIGCCFWYPNQLGSTANPVQYPPTISTVASDPEEANSYVNSVAVKNALFVNPWIAMDFTNPHQVFVIEEIQGTAWHQFIRINQSYDVDRLTDIQLNPNFSYRGDWPSNGIMDRHANTLTDCAGFEIGKADQLLISKCFSYGFHRGIWIHPIAGFNPNGIMIEQSGFEGANFPLIIEGTVRRIKVCDVTLGTLISANGNASIYINLTPSAISEIILESVTSFGSNREALYANNVNVLFMDKLSLFGSCQNNPGFTISAVTVLNAINVTLRDSIVEVAGASNNLATNVNFGTVNGFVTDGVFLLGQTKPAASEFFIVGTHGRVQKTLIAAGSAGTKSVTLGTVTDVIVTDTMVY